MHRTLAMLFASALACAAQAPRREAISSLIPAKGATEPKTNAATQAPAVPNKPSGTSSLTPPPREAVSGIVRPPEAVTSLQKPSAPASAAPVTPPGQTVIRPAASTTFIEKPPLKPAVQNPTPSPAPAVSAKPEVKPRAEKPTLAVPAPPAPDKAVKPLPASPAKMAESAKPPSPNRAHDDVVSTRMKVTPAVVSVPKKPEAKPAVLPAQTPELAKVAATPVPSIAPPPAVPTPNAAPSLVETAHDEVFSPSRKSTPSVSPEPFARTTAKIPLRDLEPVAIPDDLAKSTPQQPVPAGKAEPVSIPDLPEIPPELPAPPKPKISAVPAKTPASIPPPPMEPVPDVTRRATPEPIPPPVGIPGGVQVAPPPPANALAPYVAKLREDPELASIAQEVAAILSSAPRAQKVSAQRPAVIGLASEAWLRQATLQLESIPEAQRPAAFQQIVRRYRELKSQEREAFRN